MMFHRNVKGGLRQTFPIAIWVSRFRKHCQNGAVQFRKWCHSTYLKTLYPMITLSKRRRSVSQVVSFDVSQDALSNDSSGLTGRPMVVSILIAAMPTADHALGAACRMVQRHELWSFSFTKDVIRPISRRSMQRQLRLNWTTTGCVDPDCSYASSGPCAGRGMSHDPAS